MQPSLSEPALRARPPRPAGRAHLRNLPVRSKLVAVLAIPAAALVVVASLSIVSTLQTSSGLRRGSQLARLEHQAVALVHELQLERDLAAGAIAGSRQSDRTQAGIPTLAAQRAAVDRAVRTYRTAAAARSRAASPALRAQLATIQAELAQLPALRTATTSAALTEQAVAKEYSRIIAAVLGIDLQAGLRGGDDQLIQRTRAFSNIASAKELTAKLRGTLYAIAIRGHFGFGEFQDFADLLARQQAALNQFQADATGQQRALFANTVKGPAVLAVARIQQAAVNRQARSELNLDPEQWLAASTTQIELLRIVQAQLLDGVIQRSQSLASAAQRRWVTNSLLILLVLSTAVLGALGIAQSMVRPLQRLRASALDVAERRLPEAVRRLRMTRAGEPDVEVVPIGDASADEIGQVARAFDAVHYAAIHQATGQAALRKSIGDMFLNLARRSQRLIEQQVQVIDELERDADPDLLERLFRVDHLTTRLRRNAEGLIVLSGAEAPRRWTQPVPLVQVIRAAAQEVEDYQRVEVLAIDELDLAGHAVAEVVHLLAELIENATSFSPPGTVVQIAGQPTASGYVVEIEDRGLGMSDEELHEANQRLANPPTIDFAVSHVLGLFVVGRLAKRYGIKVQLRHSWYGGVTALVLLPSALTIPSASAAAGYEQDPAGRAGLTTADGPSDPTTDRLPIFEQARKDWFSPPSPGGLRPPPGHQVEQAPPPAPSSATDAPPSAWATSAVLPHTNPALPMPTGPHPSPPPPATSPRPAPPPSSGLPRRAPGTRMAPELATPPEASLGPARPGRSPEEIRAMLSNYRSGLERGRRLAAGLPPDRHEPPVGPPPDAEDLP